MSIGIPITNPIEIVSIEERTWRVEGFTDKGTDYRITYHRERLYFDAQGTVVKREELPQVTRTVSRVRNDPKAMQMLGLISDRGDFWAEEDASANPQG